MLHSGARLGPYEILSPIASGGMGEVYRARDARLDRTVAIKVLPPHIASDPQFRDRFEREARAISQLNHPHICTLHDVGEAPDPAAAGAAAPIKFLVMEYLEGQTIAERLASGGRLRTPGSGRSQAEESRQPSNAALDAAGHARRLKPVPLEEALKISIQICDALDKAHRHGIIHRDLKPGNVMLTKSGAKLLDFGLAKAAAGLAGGPVLPGDAAPTSPTKTTPLTAQGMLLGTFQYMAPEQIEGHEADARTDIWAFGALLYEMVTGTRAFEGRTQSNVMAAILERDPPPLGQALPVAPESLQRVIGRCLAKNPDDRWQSAADIAFELGIVMQETASTPASSKGPRRRAERAAWTAAAGAAVVAICALALAVVAWQRSRVQPGDRTPMRFLLSEHLPALSGDPQPAFAISRDGRRVVYVAEAEGVRRLYLRDMHALDARPIPGTEGARAPFFSPDGQRIGFFADGLKTLSLEGGAALNLSDAPNPRGAVWADDDTIIFSPTTDTGLWQVPSAGGTRRQVAAPDAAKRERSYRWPSLLPGGRDVIFTIAKSDIVSFDDASVAVRSLATGTQQEVLRGGSFATYSPTGHLVYARGGTLLAVPLDVTRREVTAAPMTVLNGAMTYPINGAAQFAISASGTLVYMPGAKSLRSARLVWVDRSGRRTSLAVSPAPYQSLSLSPDGAFAAVDIDGANANIWLLELRRAIMTRLTLEWSNNDPAWSPDGSRVAFLSSRAGGRNVFWQGIDTRTPAEAIADADRIRARASFSPDGRLLSVGELDPATRWDIWILTLDGSKRTPFVQTAFNETNPKFSPDGRWLAYTSDETGHEEVYVRPFPGPGRTWRISVDGGAQTVWARSGRELFYIGPAGLMSVRFDPAGSPPGDPQVLFPLSSTYPFDVAPDGRFLMIEDLPAGRTSTPIAVVLDWFSELTKLK